MFTPHSTQSRINLLCLKFPSVQPRPNQKSRHPHLPTRTILPTLALFEFRVVSEYLEELDGLRITLS